jgi:hypothetical protein
MFVRHLFGKVSQIHVRLLLSTDTPDFVPEEIRGCQSGGLIKPAGKDRPFAQARCLHGHEKPTANFHEAAVQNQALGVERDGLPCSPALDLDSESAPPPFQEPHARCASVSQDRNGIRHYRCNSRSSPAPEKTGRCAISASSRSWVAAGAVSWFGESSIAELFCRRRLQYQAVDSPDNLANEASATGGQTCS